MPAYYYGFIFFISLFLGSFYNVVALRTLSGEKMALPPSHCTTCNHRLSPLDLFPVLSWLFLRGKCRYCKDEISPIYPFGEVLTAASYTLIVYTYGFTPEALIQIAFITFMVFATVTDLKETIVPDRFIVIGILLVLALRLALGGAVLPYVLGGAGAFTMMLLILILGGGDKMGGADVKIYALIGLSLGFLPAVGSLFYASIIALLVNLPGLLLKKKSRTVEIPFVPFITLGILAVYLIGIDRFLPL